MRDADFQHDRNIRRHQRRQIRDFPNMIGTHFRNQKVSFRMYFERSQRQSDFIVERSDRRNRRSYVRQQRLHEILGSGFSDGTGDANHRKRRFQRTPAFDIVLGQRAQGKHRIFHHDLRHSGTVDLMVDYCGNSALSAYLRHIIVAIHAFSGNRHEYRSFNNLS